MHQTHPAKWVRNAWANEERSAQRILLVLEQEALYFCRSGSDWVLLIKNAKLSLELTFIIENLPSWNSFYCAGREEKTRIFAKRVISPKKYIFSVLYIALESYIFCGKILRSESNFILLLFIVLKWLPSKQNFINKKIPNMCGFHYT